MPKKRRTSAEKLRDDAVDAACQRLVNGICIPIMDTVTIHKAGQDAAEKGEDYEAAIMAAINRVRVK